MAMPWTKEGKLLKAAKAGDARKVRGLLEDGVDPNTKDAAERYVLVHAAARVVLKSSRRFWSAEDTEMPKASMNKQHLCPLTISTLSTPFSRRVLIRTCATIDSSDDSIFGW